MGFVDGFFVAAIIDAPQVYDCTVTSVPGSAALPTQVVAQMPRDTQKMIVFCSTNRYIGVYRGSVGNETLACIIGGGHPTYFEVTFRQGDRVSVRNMETDAIVTGSFTLQFLAPIHGN